MKLRSLGFEQACIVFNKASVLAICWIYTLTTSVTSSAPTALLASKSLSTFLKAAALKGPTSGDPPPADAPPAAAPPADAPPAGAITYALICSPIPG